MENNRERGSIPRNHHHHHHHNSSTNHERLFLETVCYPQQQLKMKLKKKKSEEAEGRRCIERMDQVSEHERHHHQQIRYPLIYRCPCLSNQSKTKFKCQLNQIQIRDRDRLFQIPRGFRSGRGNAMRVTVTRGSRSGSQGLSAGERREDGEYECE